MHSISFIDPPESSVDILVIAGEVSGDEHASILVENLLKDFPHLKISALGGMSLKSKGAHLIYPLIDHAVVGLFEVLKNYFLFKNLFSKTILWIKKFRPKLILLVDYPGFNLRLANELKKIGISVKGGGEVKVLQYISPQLWAWKPKRRFMMEKVLDGLAVIFKFELKCYQDTSLPVAFVGHPFVSVNFKKKIFYDPNGSLLILPGSRVQPVQRILPVFLDTYEMLLLKFPTLKAEIPVPDQKIRKTVETILKTRSDLKKGIRIIENFSKLNVCAALMSSGTMSFECAIAGIPGVIGYRSHPLTYYIGRKLVKIQNLGMANILLSDKPPYKEFLQNAANKANLKNALDEILNDDNISNYYKRVSDDLLQLLRAPQDISVDKWLLAEL